MTSVLLKPSLFDAESVVGICENLSSTKRRRFSKQNRKDNLCEPEEALLLWIEDTLLPLGFDKDVLDGILDELKSDLLKFGKTLWRALEGRYDGDKTKLPVALIGMADRQFLTMTGINEILDIKTWKWLPGNKHAFLETIQYNLTTLFMRRYLRLKYQRNEDDSSNTSEAITE